MNVSPHNLTKRRGHELYRHFNHSDDSAVGPLGRARFLNEFSCLADTNRWSSLWAVTLTLKQVIVHPDGTKEFLDIYRCEKNFRQFMNRLNRAVFRNALARHGKQLRVINVHEKGVDTRYHTHAAIEGPTRLTEDAFRRLIHASWAGTPWGDRIIDIRPNADQGWLDYQFKPYGKSGLERWSDCIDWGSFHNPIADA